MKNILLILTVIFTVTVAHGQLNPVNNLSLNASYQYGNNDCPQYNCFVISWTAPNSSIDTLVGYKMYENDSLYMTFPTSTNSYGCSGFTSLGCSINSPNFLWFLPPYDGHPFYCKVKAVYNKDSSLSIATDSLHFMGVAIGVNENNYHQTISIFPNAFSSQTTLQSDKILKNATLTIYNSCGQTVKQINNFTGQTIIIHRDNLPNGLYFLRLIQDNRIISSDKLVITDN